MRSGALLLVGCVHVGDLPSGAEAPALDHPHARFSLAEALDEILRAAPDDFQALHGPLQTDPFDHHVFAPSNVQLPGTVSTIVVDEVVGTSFLAEYDALIDEVAARAKYANTIAAIGHAHPPCCRLSVMSGEDPNRTVFLVAGDFPEPLAIVVELDRDFFHKIDHYVVHIEIGAAR
jgi:hypothetical protein